MTTPDLIVLDRFLSTVSDTLSITLHSPCDEQTECFKKYCKDVTVITRDDWDITEKSPIRTGVLFLSNVMMYIKDPAPVIENLKESCHYLIIQDLIRRDRSGNGTEFCNDGDCMRYSFGDERATISNAFDLTYLDPLYFEAYDDGSSRHFLMML